MAVYELACGRGDSTSCAEAGKIYLSFRRDVAGYLQRGLYLSGRGCDGKIAWACGERASASKETEVHVWLEKGCALGHGESCSELGMRFIRGKEGLPDADAAAHWWNSGCSFNHGESCASLAHLAMREEYPDYRFSQELFLKACDLKEFWSCLKLAEWYIDGEYVERSFKQAAQFAARACKAEVAEGCALQAWSELADGNNKELNQERLLKSCEKGSAWGCYYSAEALQNSERDRERRRAMLYRSCTGGVTRGCSALAQVLLESGKTKDEADAVEILRSGCESEGTEPCLELARLYREGRGVTKDERYAEELSRRACKNGVREACSTASPSVSQDTRQKKRPVK